MGTFLPIDFRGVIISIQIITIIVLITIYWKMKKRYKSHTDSHMGMEWLKFKSSSKAHIGDRDIQQDHILYQDCYMRKMSMDLVAVLCDGMGGVEHGEIASKLTATEMMSRLVDISETEIIPDLLSEAVDISTKKLYDFSVSQRIAGKMGTTVIAAVIRCGKLYWVSVGDSHLYLLRDSELICMNQDHNYCNVLLQKVRDQEIKREEAFQNKDGNKLTSYIGLEKVNEIDHNLRPFILKEKDRLLVCSDGIYHSLSDIDMKSLLQNNLIENVADEMISTILSKHLEYQDNMSVIAVEYLGKDT